MPIAKHANHAVKGPKADLRRVGSTWQLQEAKNRLSEVVQFSISDGPQTITLHGKPSAVVLSFESYKKLSTRNEPLVDFLLGGLRGTNLDLERGEYPVGDVEL
jgi:antitoxin Phd